MSNVVSINIALEKKIDRLVASMPASVIEQAERELERHLKRVAKAPPLMGEERP